ncbi:hypothetical protein FXV77_08730 [Sphingobacterium phlebotomi]|uniref:Uncharacterized protein n=1 Tax=Sphingobacterium phlebotomi TaxID=2605433 RepID=A0A5D4H9R4_9SPHI|nr:hypothetical protein [Sphingobacterium phlebotomi]TYR36579.1 hypothetical protein FXV77_08730 [Sphingobacterium phlebotomi]
MIKTIVKEHPLKNITLDFDDEITPPPFEQKALQSYYEAHDKTWKIKEHVSKIEAELKAVDDIIEDLSFRRLGIEQELEILEDWLGVTELEDKELFDGEITIDIGTFFAVCDKHNVDIQNLYEKVVGLTEIYNRDIENIYEDDAVIDPEYFNALDEVYPRYEEVSVHTVSLDDDHQAFLEEYGKVEELFFHYTALAREIFDKYKSLVETTQVIYRRVEVIDQLLRDKLKKEE